MELSKGYHLSEDSSLYGVIIRNEDAENIKSVEDLADRTIITQSGSLQEALANENIKEYKEFKRVSSMQDAFLAVQESKADAAVIDIENARLYIQNNPGCDMMIVEAATLGWYVLEYPQSQRVTIFRSQFTYCSRTGTW